MGANAKQAGRMTRQRRVVLEILEESREHLDAETIYTLARQRDQKISLATVYRTLARFKQHGLVEEQRLGEGHGHFEKAHSQPHGHFTCFQCGRVVELEGTPVRQLAEELCASQGLQLENVQLLVGGWCATCKIDH